MNEFYEAIQRDVMRHVYREVGRIEGRNWKLVQNTPEFDKPGEMFIEALLRHPLLALRFVQIMKKFHLTAIEDTLPMFENEPVDNLVLQLEGRIYDESLRSILVKEMSLTCVTFTQVRAILALVYRGQGLTEDAIASVATCYYNSWRGLNA